MLKKSFPAAQNQDTSSFTPPGKRRTKRNKSSQAYISEPLVSEPLTPGVNESVSPWDSPPFGQSQIDIRKLSSPSVKERSPNQTPSPRSEISTSPKEEKDDLELGESIDIGSSFMTLKEPPFNIQHDEEEMFSGDKDGKIAELTLKCAKIKKKYVSEKESVSLLHLEIDELKQSLKNERKRYGNLEKNLSLKEDQMSQALKQTTDLKQKLRKASIDDTVTARARKSKKDIMSIPEDLDEFKEQLKKIQNSKNKLEELASQIFDKYYDSKQELDNLSKTSKETQEKYNKLLFDYRELGKFKENMIKKYDLGQHMLKTMSNDVDKAVERKLQPSHSTIDKLKKEIKQVQEELQGKTFALKTENTQLLEKFKDLENKKDGAEDALKEITKESQMMVNKLGQYKSQVEQHELTIRKWKCYLIKETDYLHQGPSNGILQSLSSMNPEIKKELDEENDEKGMTEMTLRIYKIPATGIIFLEVGSDCTNSIVPALRRGLFDIREVRHLLTESGQDSDRLSIAMPDQDLLLQSSQAEDIVQTLNAILEVNNQWISDEKKETTSEPIKMRKLRKFSLPIWRGKLTSESMSPSPSLPIFSDQIQLSETRDTQRTSFASFFTCI
jgi:myosin heavy subunit